MPEPKVVTPQFEGKDDILAVVVEMKSVLSEVVQGSSDQRIKMEKMSDELRTMQAKQEEFQTLTTTTLGQLSEEEQQKNASIFDVAINQPTLRSMWGYGDSVERALYRPHVDYDHRVGSMVHDGKGYELDSQVMAMNDAIYLFAMHKAMTIASKNPGEAVSYAKIATEMDTFKMFQYELGRNSELSKALAAANDGAGAEYVPTGLSAQLIDDVRLALRVAGLFPNITMPAKSGAWEVPNVLGRKGAYIIGEPQTDSASKIPAVTSGTAKKVFTAVTHGLRMLFSDDLDEDSLVAMMPLVRAELVAAIADAMENAVINGDITDSTHFDSDVTAANDIRKSWDGLRKFSGGSSGNAAVDISTLSLANMRAIRKKMGIYGAKAENNAWIPGVSGFVQMLSIDEVETAEKWGTGFTAKAGTLAMLDGSPVVPSEFIREDLTTAGIYDGVTTTDTIILYANTKAHWTAQKPSGLKVETDRDIETQQTVAVASQRVAFTRVQVPGDNEATVGLGYSLTR